MIASIIITNYNYEKYLARCLRSCLAQTVKEDYEVILVDDKSNDKSNKIANEFLGIKNFKFIKNKKNIGVAASANAAIRKAKGKYFLRVDSDDFISKHTLQYLLFFMEYRKDLLGVACDYTLINKQEKKIKRIDSKENPISCGILYNKEKFIDLGMYNNNYRHREEEELRVRLGDSYKIEYLHIPLYRYRMHSENKTKTGEYKIFFKRKIAKLQNHKILNEIKSKKILKKDKVIAIIPARGGSKRFKMKNIAKIWGKPMIYWSIQAAKDTNLIKDIYVTSDNIKILQTAKKYGAKTILRPKELAGDRIPKIYAISHAVEKIKNIKKNDLIVILQANSPNVSCFEITKCVYNLKKFNRNEIMSLDKNLMQNAAIRVLKSSSINQRFLSTYCGGVISNTIDVHYKKDLKKIN